MAIADKIEALKSQFDKCVTWDAKYEKIIELGKKWPGLDDQFKTEDLKIKGCQSQVWLKAEMGPNKTILFSGDSDALLVRGLVALIVTVYSGETPQDILNTDVVFLKDMGFDTGLSPSRSNGLFSMVKQIKYYATAFQYLLSK
ncbi:MAG: Fe-S metabolism protein SufE [Bdellovibrionales bacterium RIFCSPHIGHO2_01_FULL_40_29]|nr:MAG: Fe-S metabolism protein SufE [Bdellovibrionales bacterium RIFCSPHIGHO2_01_FULL_40_29]OFZ35617.1 MAG: Fe-S metabolism protein SufE [Bdellovibrionales bacterium RIFCSPHIGHO2_02_FULL_40_15]